MCSHFSTDLRESRDRVQGRLGATAPLSPPPRGDTNAPLWYDALTQGDSVSISPTPFHAVPCIYANQRVLMAAAGLCCEIIDIKVLQCIKLHYK